MPLFVKMGFKELKVEIFGEDNADSDGITVSRSHMD